MRDTFIQARLDGITPPDGAAMEAARRHWDAIAKPLHGLGRLEDMVVRIAGAVETPEVRLDRKGVAVFCADNGVVAEGVTQTGQEVTLAVARSMAAGQSSVCRMARVAGAEVLPVDVGMLAHEAIPGLRARVVMEGGTRNMTKGPAMDRAAGEAALRAGMETAEELAGRGMQLLAAGEMGIGNTTTTAAVAAALLGRSPEETVGRGAGLSDGGLVRKRRAVAAALAVNQPDPTDPMDVLCKVGGLDIAAMTGFYLGCAFQKLPVLLDGAISCAAALCAVRLCPWAEKSLLASHRPAEPCGQLLLDALGLEPVLDAGLRLGEGTGAAAAMPLLDMALSVYGEMHAFGGLGVPASRADGRSPEEGELCPPWCWGERPAERAAGPRI